MGDKKEKLILVFIVLGNGSIIGLCPYVSGKTPNTCKAITNYSSFDFEIKEYNDCKKAKKNQYQDLYNHIVNSYPEMKVLINKKIDWKKYKKSFKVS